MTTLVTSVFSTCKANGGGRNGNCKPVMCTSGKYKGTVYASMTDAMEATGIYYQCISNAVHGRQKKAGGMTWCLVDDVKNNIDIISEQLQQDAEDARKWREYQAEQERIRKAEEKRQAAIEKTKAKIAHLEELYDKKYKAMEEAYACLNDARIELEVLEMEG